MHTNQAPIWLHLSIISEYSSDKMLFQGAFKGQIKDSGLATGGSASLSPLYDSSEAAVCIIVCAYER